MSEYEEVHEHTDDEPAELFHVKDGFVIYSSATIALMGEINEWAIMSTQLGRDARLAREVTAKTVDVAERLNRCRSDRCRVCLMVMFYNYILIRGRYE